MNLIPRRSLLALAAVAAIALPALGARADDFPSKPITILLGFGPGGTTDTAVRLYGEKMSEILGVPVLIENKPGGQQLNVIREIKRAKPDGYTLYAATGSALVQNPALRDNLSYSLDDFTPISRLIDNPGVIFVDPDLPVKNISELIGYAKTHPDTFTYAAAGVGSAGHLYTEALLSLAGAQATGVQYSADNEVIREVVAGNAQMGTMSTLNSVPLIKAGELHALAVTTEERLPILPDVPALPELGIPGIEHLSPYTFIALVGPAGMPEEVTRKLSETIMQIGAMPEIQDRIRNTLFSIPSASSPEDFKAFIAEQISLWEPLKSKVELPGL